MYAVPPKDGDRFFVRLLLLHTPNVCGFTGESGLMPSGANSWQEAAEIRGLVETDDEYVKVMQEASLTHMPSLLRDVFVQLIVYCKLSNPGHLERLSKRSL